MSKFKRREALRIAVAGALGTTAASLASIGDAQQPAWVRRIPFQTHGFNAEQTGIIRRAVQIVGDRMLNPAMFRNADANYQRSYVTNFYGPNASGAGDISSGRDFEEWFVRVQLPALANGFPTLHIYARDLGQNTGRARLDLVRTYLRRPPGGFFVNSIPTAQGTFQIELNSRMVGSRRHWFGTDANVWAGTIVHEMLHNLGHKHPRGVYNGTFIREYENAVIHNGAYRPGLQLHGGALPGCGA